MSQPINQSRQMPTGYDEAYSRAIFLNLSYPEGRALYLSNRRQNAANWYSGIHLDNKLRSTRESTAIRWMNHYFQGGSIKSIHKTSEEHNKEVREYRTLSRLPKRDLSNLLTPDIREKIQNEHQRYINSVCSTEPADHSAAEDAIYSLYKKNHLSKPQILWGNSPLESAKICAELGSRNPVQPRPLNLAQIKLGMASRALYCTIGDYEIYRKLTYSNNLPNGPQPWELAGVSREIQRRVRVNNSYHDLWWNCRYNQQDQNSYLALPHLEAFRDISEQYQIPELIQLLHSCGWYWTYDKIVVLTERPTKFHTEPTPSIISYSRNGISFHNEAGPAVAYADGFALYYWHGIPVPAHVILNPNSITLKQIQKQRNTEVRRVLLERFGFERYISEIGALPVDADQFGTLYKVAQKNDESLTILSVMNSTPERIGDTNEVEYKRYLLRVPPNILTSREAVAWTFGLTANTYDPQQQT